MYLCLPTLNKSKCCIFYSHEGDDSDSDLDDYVEIEKEEDEEGIAALRKRNRELIDALEQGISVDQDEELQDDQQQEEQDHQII